MLTAVNAFREAPELPYESFNAERASAFIGQNPWEVWKPGTDHINPGFTLLGKADGAKIRVRPKPGCIVVMVEEDRTGERFWFHLPENVMDL